MDKQEWTPKERDLVWWFDPRIIRGPMQVLIYNVDEWGGVIDREGGWPLSFFFPTREAAKAALIEKLEQALEEARKL